MFDLSLQKATVANEAHVEDKSMSQMEASKAGFIQKSHAPARAVPASVANLNRDAKK
jgi:hypothetical protein